VVPPGGKGECATRALPQLDESEVIAFSVVNAVGRHGAESCESSYARSAGSGSSVDAEGPALGGAFVYGCDLVSSNRSHRRHAGCVLPTDAAGHSPQRHSRRERYVQETIELVDRPDERMLLKLSR
jgi:hypothetical protein